MSLAEMAQYRVQWSAIVVAVLNICVLLPRCSNKHVTCALAGINVEV